MPRLNAANRAQSKLVSGINSSATIMTVDDASSFPDAPFLVTIENEIIEVGAINRGTNVLSTLLRGREGTTAADHDEDAVVRNEYTAGTYGELTTKAYVDGLVGDIGDVLDLINGEVI